MSLYAGIQQQAIHRMNLLRIQSHPTSAPGPGSVISQKRESSNEEMISNDKAHYIYHYSINV